MEGGSTDAFRKHFDADDVLLIVLPPKVPFVASMRSAPCFLTDLSHATHFESGSGYATLAKNSILPGSTSTSARPIVGAVIVIVVRRTTLMAIHRN